MNPKDIMTDAIHNFHPQYQQYTQYSAGTVHAVSYLLRAPASVNVESTVHRNYMHFLACFRRRSISIVSAP